MGDRGRVLVKVSTDNDKWVLKQISKDYTQEKLSQTDLLKLEDKLFKYKLNLQGTFGEDNIENEEIIINEN